MTSAADEHDAPIWVLPFNNTTLASVRSTFVGAVEPKATHLEPWEGLTNGCKLTDSVGAVDPAVDHESAPAPLGCGLAVPGKQS